ncbi:hypothetical protein VTK56DRAFT_4936 [Thermocarpiscus australiensis]
MPISLPGLPVTSSTSSSSSTPPTATGTAIAAGLKSRLFPPLDFTTTRGKSVAAILLCRAFYNLVHFVPAALSGHALAALFQVADQLLVTFCISLIAERRGGRRVFGVRVGEVHFDIFLVACAGVHLIYTVFLIWCIVSLAILFGITGGTIMTVVGVVVAAVAVVASRPEHEEGNLSLP